METDEPVKDAVPTEPEQTTPAPEHVPPAVASHNECKTALESLSSKVDELASTVTGLVEGGNAPRDSTPVKKPWTHRFGG